MREVRTRALLPKIAYTVSGATSAALAIAFTEVRAKPSRSNRGRAASRMRARVRAACSSRRGDWYDRVLTGFPISS